MTLSLDQILFYGGALAAFVGAVVLVVCLIRYRIAAGRLNARLDEEYGPKVR